ncbi:unnamed protein product [Closterium sp. NIES-65]|nr:unnamed protein product [Closterium sp. NIES-65]
MRHVSSGRSRRPIAELAHLLLFIALEVLHLRFSAVQRGSHALLLSSYPLLPPSFSMPSPCPLQPLSARQLAARFAAGDLPFTALYSSDLRRAAETAEAVAEAVGMGGEQVVRLQGLRERNLGVLEGLVREEASRNGLLALLFLTLSDSCEHKGGGESLEAMYGRVTTTVNRIAKEHLGQRVLLVTHGGVCNCIQMKASGNRHAKKVYNTSIGIVRITPPDKWTILRWADIEHLKAVDYDKQAFGGGADSG